MALRRTLTHHRYLNPVKISGGQRPPLRRIVPDSGEEKRRGGDALRRFLHRRPIADPLAAGRLPIPVGDELLDRIRALSPHPNRLGGLLAPPPPAPAPAAEEEKPLVTAEEARKAVRAAQMEAVRARLRGMLRSCVSHGEFEGICGEVAGEKEGKAVAKALDDAGAVIVLGDVVFLRPELVAKAIESMIPASMSPARDPRREELKEMEEQKATIDEKAEALVRRELWAGLGFLAVQTAAFMRLTFWELSWDVMEPICFYVTSGYFMAGYAFFLTTSRDPSFEGFFQSRFAAKQKRLMRAHNFDADRFDELKRGGLGGLPPAPPPLPTEELSPRSSECRHHRNTLIGTVY